MQAGGELHVGKSTLLMSTEADLCVCEQEAGLRCAEFFPLGGVIPAPGGVIEVLHVGLAQRGCPV